MFAQDRKPSVAEIRQKAEAGDPIAQFDLGRAYIAGDQVAKDPAQGVSWVRKSADQGYVGAEYALAYMYQVGAEKLPKDQHEAANWYRKAASQQNKAAQQKLADMSAAGLISADEANWQTKTAKTEQKAIPHSVPPQTRQTKSFSLREVETGLTGGITSKRMTTLIEKFGVNFKLDNIARKRLADEGADDNLLAAIARRPS